MDKFKLFKEYIYKYQLGQTLDKVSFKCLTSLKMGGTCKILYIPDDVESLNFAIKHLKELELPFFIIGAGTNLLVNDREFEMVVITLKKLKRYYITKEDEDDVYIYVEAGVRAPILSDYIANKQLAGAEFLSVIPGTIGGLTYMNAGAYKKSMAELIDSVTFIDEDGNLQTVKNKDNNLKFNYRDSVFKYNKWTIVSITIKLDKNSQVTEKPKDKIKRYLKVKKESQPIDVPNAGSTFKNNNDIYTWQIIDKLGFRGYQVGGALVSDKHANFLVNVNEASFSDMLTLIELIKNESIIKLGINLECEWEIIE